ncbi:hypothetical protein ACFHPT_06860 [Enterococcus faecium]|uniref:class I mannose-6-phosphate isomerase n=3 Tax=Enterococcus faecium TaxID=1352 RepID=UPI001E4CFDD3|nr:class I mannose-6-phosphate isomerase [Enterococcus faecium]MCE3178996.1 class I mannose-6-phosphate isomerase [Enterococcus faecium]
MMRKRICLFRCNPTDEYATKKENGQPGKTEMWYVLDASKVAGLIYGLQTTTEETVIRDAIAQGAVERYLQKVPVKKDVVFFIEAGTIHAIGVGALIAEIQENSNLNGMSEPKQPLRVLKYRAGVASELLFRCKYFEVYRMIVNTERSQIVHYSADSVSIRVPVVHQWLWYSSI